tara:strand:- start:63 stop:845 length:783 start_codon:yes stop_codon:yes gene_type:complete
MSTTAASKTNKKVMPSDVPTKLMANYISMIAEAILATGERGGMSRDAIWKYLVMKFPKATSNERGKKIYLARLKKYADEGNHITYGKNRGRFQLNANFRSQIATRKARGLSTIAASDHAILKKSFNPKKSMTKNKKNTRAKTAKGKSKNQAKKTKERKAKESKRLTKAKDNKTKKAAGAAKGAAAAKPKPKAKGKAADKSPARGRSASPAKGKKAANNSKSPAKGGRKPSKSPAKGGKSPAKGGRKPSKSPAKGGKGGKK